MMDEKIGDTMNIYRILKNGILSRKEITGQIENVSMDDAVVSLQREEFSSSEIVPLVQEDFLDTNDPLTIEKYKSNIRLLVDQAKEKGKVDEFRLIREDDFFPWDWMWSVSSKETGREYSRSNLAFSLRMAKAKDALRRKKKDDNNPFDFDIPFQRDDVLREASSIPMNYGRVYEPVHFRSTKHFTINTPLPYTGSYNQVESERRFIVIDSLDSFVSSGYGYSMDYQDAYLDVTHEGLPISSSAIVLIAEDQYPEIVQDEKVREELSERRVVRYRGDEATAINMVLSENGVLPYRMGRFRQFDPELEEIMVQSMKNLCHKTSIDYSLNHGNLFGKGGHFSDLLDSVNSERSEFEHEFISFMRSALPEYSGLINNMIYHYPDKIIQAIGYERVWNAVEQYNAWAKKDEVGRRESYKQERDSISSEMHEDFLHTLELIKVCYAKEEVPSELESSIPRFFHGSLSEQIEASKKIQQYFYQDEIKR